MHTNSTVEKLAWQRWANSIGQIRRTVFIEEQGVLPKYEWDDLDASAIHLGILSRPGENELKAYARLLREGKLTRMAVLREHRNQGLGSKLVEATRDWAQELGLKSITLDAQLSAVEFYKKQGFVAFGDPFWDAGIEHIQMTTSIEQP